MESCQRDAHGATGRPEVLPDLPASLQPRDEPLEVLPSVSRARAVPEPQRAATTPPSDGIWPPLSRERVAAAIEASESGEDKHLSIAQIYGF